ncbi:YbaB/EbfC family nucleoid-associated protein [Ahrensia marina]|uniref:YbaB/EbfC family nucleoid-associated protein n=1 Tax=Ahrensia marina TaxID=1514904 RepID=UPI0035CF7A2C
MDIMKMMKQAKDMQEKMQTMQAEMADETIDGSAGGGMVTVTLSGKGELSGLKIDPSLLVPDDVEILEDLLIAAHSDAKMKADQMMAEKTQSMMQGMGLPPGMKLPGM